LSDPAAQSAQSDQLRLLGFDPASLAANRDGLMSGRQQSRLVWSAAWRLIPAVLLVPTGLVIAFFAWEFWTLAIPLLFVFAGFYLGWRGFSFCADAVDGDVSVAEGALVKHLQRTKNGTRYYVRLGPLSKGISKSTYLALPWSIDCRGYYAPGSRAFLSVEPASTPAPTPRRLFGPSNSAAWDRLRWSVLVALLAAPAVLFGAHLYASAQPAHFRALDGTISGYRETHGKSSSYYVSLSDAGELRLRTNPANFTPSLADLGQRIGTQATLYVRDQNDEVAAIRFNGDQLYETNIYAEPGIQKTGMQIGGGLVALIGLALLIPAIWRLAGTPAAAAPVPKQDTLHWERSERGLVTVVASTVALVLVIYAGIAAGWAWLQVGGDWGAWSLLGLAAAASAAAGRPIYRALRQRYSSGRLPLWSGLLASVVAPAVVLAIGAGLAHSSPAVIVIALGAVAFVAAASRMALAAKPA
jgi:hypothetical protein